MIKAELYTEFREDRTDKVTVEKAELRRKLKKIKNGAILERENEKYQLYYSPEAFKKDEAEHVAPYHLVIDPAARIRFEGSLDEYDKLLEEIDLKCMDHDDAKVYSKLKEGNADSDFFIMDVYYQM
ncbi:DUF5975 family protein [Butyrivibrio sp. INlla21]|uniref:DUF5975 family protein n=1 Tax=Butyrivibrio sp. INlla21 TaxID=1520811 RepID=UPI0008E0C12D|nr:DUF5975 family protein [Butyrivibrio sp. INlla21]SFU96240.1 hypothetical protein SAMN02910342_02618 [Butyrivibrio sp. INlla21]